MNLFQKFRIILMIGCIFAGYAFQALNAAPVYIANYSQFPVFPYNTGSYMRGGAFVGCGPTTGAMIFAYFQHVNSLSNLLTSPGSGVNEGIETAWVLHSTMNTGTNGFGSPYDIKPGLETYATNRGYTVKATIHASPTVDPGNTDWAVYGAYGDAWMNDGYFWHDLGGGYWGIDVNDFCDFINARISVGVGIFITMDSDASGGGDHWVPLVGYDRTTGKYAFYDTWNTTIVWGDIFSCFETTPRLYAISGVRSVTYVGSTSGPLPPKDLTALNGYNGVIPLAWNSPTSTNLPLASTSQSNSVLGDRLQGTMPFVSTQSDEKFPFEFPPELMKQYQDALADGSQFETGANSAIPTPNSPAAFKGYNVYRSTSLGGTYTKIANQISRQYYRDSAISNGTTYYYKVKAVYDAGESEYSNATSGKAQSDGFTIPSGWASIAPNLDGIINSSEWSNAVAVDITYPGYTGTVTLYAMNNNSKLYLAVDDQRDTHLDDRDQVAIFFDENLDREWPASTPSGEGNLWFAWDAATSSAFSVFAPRHGYWPDNLGWENFQTPSGVSTGIAFSGGRVQYEGSIDLSTSPLNASPGSVIGILFHTYDKTKQFYDAFWPQESERLKVVIPDINWWGQAPFSYGDLKLSSGASAPDISVTPTSWNYGDVQQGNTSDKTFVVKNEGSATLSVSSVSLTGGQSTQF
ncbi:hypothetical protein JXJ21_23115, partial [candidate division KSB1 bacterium]|nr:hypothetical protein [candidate division KSB1 bacterium]